jgi:hypothetical protein
MDSINFSVVIPFPNGTELNQEQIQWAESIGISAERAKWLASCPAGTRCGDKDKPMRVLKYNPVAFIHKAPSYRNYYFRIHRRGVKIVKKLSPDLEESMNMRDAICRQMGIYLVPKPE